MDKAFLRAGLRDRIAAVPPLRRAEEEGLVNAAIRATPAWAAAQTVLLYKHKGHEFSVVPLGNAAFLHNKRVLFPRVAGRGVLDLHVVRGWSELSAGAYGIAEPSQYAETVSPEEVDLAIVPGLGWTEEGGRLGQGGGFYDRLLPRLGGPAWGVGFTDQLLPELPLEPHDRKVDRVWTARQVLDQD